MSIKDKSQSPQFFSIGNLLLLLAGVSFLAYLFWPRSSRLEVQPYSQFLDQVEKGKVAWAVVGNEMIRYQLKPPQDNSEDPDNLFQFPLEDPMQSLQNPKNPFHTDSSPSSETSSAQEGVLATIPLYDPDLPSKLREKGVIFAASPPQQNPWWTTLLAWVVPPLILVGAMHFLLNRGEDRRSLAFSKSKAKVYVEGEAAPITFADVAGAEEAKTELVEIVEFLKNPERYNKIGARIPKGVLLVGPPGTGKTLLAKAVAGEAGVTFFSMSASEFVELFVGTGAARVRDLFAQANKQAPCIIFIDELDAIGKSRSSGGFASGSNDEREQTLNQLITEMDGFAAGDATVIVLAATNRPETLDSALLRPGRFDRQVLVDRPDLAGRLAILEIYTRKVQLAENLDLKAIAQQTSGFAGADLANLVNEAALLAARQQRDKVSQQDLKEAIERVTSGLERKSRVLSDADKKIVAYHEVGHAIVGAVMQRGKKVEKISIVPRGLSSLGYALYAPTEERFLRNEMEYREIIASSLGGRAAEEIIFGSVTDGAYDDLRKATYYAETMVVALGMSKELGLVSYEKAQQTNFLGNGTGDVRRYISEETAKTIDKEIKQIVEAGHQQALAILNCNRDLLDAIAQQLLNTEVIEGEELQALLKQVISA
jgi:cell division protease FtsH